MKAGPFNRLIAETYGTPEKTVVVITRALKMAGLFASSGKRGRGAADLTPLEAARTTIAMLTGDVAMDAPERVCRFQTFQNARADADGFTQSFGMRDDHTIEDLLEMVFHLPPETPHFISVAFNSRVGNFVVRIDDVEVVYANLPAIARYRETTATVKAAQERGDWQEADVMLSEQREAFDAMRGDGRGMRVTREITTVEILKISTAFFPNPDANTMETPQ